MESELFSRLFLSALSAAGSGNLSLAAELARSARELSPEHEDAARLLGSCLFTLGELEEAAEVLAPFPELAGDMRELRDRQSGLFQKVEELVKRKKLLAALRAASGFPHQNVRMLLLRGCLSGTMRQYKRAARFFAEALEKDSGNVTAKRYLTEAATQKSLF